MSNSNMCKIINCLTAKINKLEKQVSNSCLFTEKKGKLFNCTDEIKILHSDINRFQESTDNNNYIIIENKLYKFNDSNCFTEYDNLLASLNAIKNAIGDMNDIFFIENLFSEYDGKKIEFNSCLSENEYPVFTPITVLSPTASTSSNVQDVINELNIFYSTEISGLCIPPEEYTKCFFTRYDEKFQEFIYLEDDGGNVVEKVLHGECNVLFECSTSKIYMFEDGIWSSKCTLQTSIASPT